MSTGGFNTFIGGEAGDVTTGAENTVVGYAAGGGTTTGGNNTFIGTSAGIANEGGGIIFVLVEMLM